VATEQQSRKRDEGKRITIVTQKGKQVMQTVADCDNSSQESRHRSADDGFGATHALMFCKVPITKKLKAMWFAYRSGE
jgi:hypothetical protein